MESYISEAIAWALDRYNKDARFRCTEVEIGNVLFVDRVSGFLRPGPNEFGESASQVRPYASSIERLLEHFAGQGDLFVGDYHCHVGSGLSWTDHVPSPEDISCHSCLGNIWRLEPPIEIADTIIDSLPISPAFQLIQANIFGDIFVVQALSERNAFATLEEQEESLSMIDRAYGTWHMVAYAGYGQLVFPVRHSEFVAQVRAELPAMNKCLAGRASIDFIENTAYVSDDEDFVA